jgi:hypothetical protein
MKTDKRRGPRLLIGVAVLSMLALTGVVVGVLNGRRHVRTAAAVDEVAETEGERASERPTSSAAAAVRHVSRPATDEGAFRRAQDQLQARAVLVRASHHLLKTIRDPQPDQMEAVGYQMEPYIQGMLMALRNTNPALVGALRDELTERACDHPQSDLELTMLSRMMLNDPDLGSPRIFDCALRGRKKEDVVLWSMMDAWVAAGRPNTEVMSGIGAFAADARTVDRLTADSPGQRARLAAIEQARIASTANEQQPQPLVKEGDR